MSFGLSHLFLTSPYSAQDASDAITFSDGMDPIYFTNRPQISAFPCSSPPLFSSTNLTENTRHGWHYRALVTIGKSSWTVNSPYFRVCFHTEVTIRK
jgi:hypothetical protein